MQMSFSPEYNHFFVQLLEKETRKELTLFRAVTDPGAVFEETYDMMSRLVDVLRNDVNIFQTCLDSIPIEGIRRALEGFVEQAPSSEDVRMVAAQDISDPALIQEIVDDHVKLLREASEAVALPEGELRAAIRLVSIQIGNTGEGFNARVAWGPRDVDVLSFFIPTEAVELTPEQLQEAETIVVDGEDDQCPFCAAGIPHPEGMEMPGEHPPAPAAAPKRTLH